MSVFMTAVVAAAAASHHAQQRRQRAEEQRRKTEERHRKAEEERRRRAEEERRRHTEEERRHREVENRRKKKEEQNRRENQEKLEKKVKDRFGVANGETYEFTDKLQLKTENLPGTIFRGEFETKYADGSYSARDKDAFILTLSDGTRRVYKTESYGNRPMELISEELPDGRMRGYKKGEITYDRDSEGNYKVYKPVHKGTYYEEHSEIKLAEEGTADGWTKRYKYESKYNQDKGLYEATDTQEIINENLEDSQSIKFTDKLELKRVDLPEAIFVGEFETKYADGSYSTRDKGQFVLSLSNGVKRIYKDDSYDYSKPMALVSEELPDGRMRSYQKGEITYDRDSEGNYKVYKPVHDGSYYEEHSEIKLAEEGTADGWTKRYKYESKYNQDKGLYEAYQIKETLADGTYTVCDMEDNLLEQGDENTYQKFYPSGHLKEEKNSDGDVYKWTDDGAMISQKLADGTEYSWTDKGVMTYEALPDGTTRRWTEEGNMLFEALPDGKRTEWGADGFMLMQTLPDETVKRWFPGTNILSYQRDKDGNSEYFDILGRVTQENKENVETTYRYYGDTTNIFDIEKRNKRTQEKTYQHFDKQGVEDTDHYLALKALAKKHVDEEKKKGEHVVLPRHSKLKKAVEYNMMLRKVKNKD